MKGKNNRPISKRIELLIYLIWITVAIFMKSDLIQISIWKFFIISLFGLAFLRVGIRGVRDKIMYSWSFKDNKKEAVVWGYIALLLSLILLFFPFS